MKKMLPFVFIVFMNFLHAQIANQPNDEVFCDDDFDGLHCFDLSFLSYLNSVVLGAQNPTDYSISYHISQQDADTNAAPLGMPFCTTTNPQTIYVRLEDNTTGMFDITNFQVSVNPKPIVPESVEIDLFECDDPFNVDGFTIFDLSFNAPFIYGNQSPNDFTLSYFETESGAISNSIGINNITSYTNTSLDQTIWVRLTNNTTGCFTVGFFFLFVEPPSNDLIEPIDFSICDTDGDSVALFNLTERANEITGGNTALTLEYFASQDDFNNETPIVDPTAYENTVNPQTIYVRYTQPPNLPFQCPSTVTLDLEVFPLPSFSSNSFSYIVCDTGSNAISTFDWDTVTASLDLFASPQQASDYVITYHETEGDALNNINPLANGYQNITSPQTVFIRAENVVANCSNLTAIASVILAVESGPTINMNPTAMEDCDPSGNGFGSFILSTKITEITNGIPLTVTFHELLEDAENGTNRITGFSYTNTTAFSQTLYVRVANVANCQTITTLDLNVTSDCLPSSSITPVYVCDDDTDGLVCVDLTTKAAEALNGLDPNDTILSYYLNENDAFYQTNEIQNPTTFCTLEVQNTVHIRIEEITTSNVTTSTFILQGLVLNATLPTPLEACDFDEDGFASFVLDSKIQEITAGDSGYTVKFYTSLGNATQDISGFNSTDFVNTTPNLQTVYARMNFLNPTFASANCFEIVPLELLVIPPSVCDATPVEDTYVVETIPYQIYTVNEVTTVNGDDIFTQIVNMPFDFDFFEQTYNEFTIGTNGFITFDTYNSGTNCRWQLQNDQLLPSLDLYLNSIYGVYHDLDNGGGSGSLGYGIIGEVPFRKMVIFFEDIDQFLFQCNDPTTTQIVLYESFNFIDVQIKEKFACLNWNSGLGVLGIQNQDASQGYAPVDRNMGVWNAINEGHRFKPTTTYDNIFSILCDSNVDGFVEFNLQNINNDLLNGETGTVSYFLSENDLLNNTNVLPELYTNTSNIQKIYARIVNVVTNEITIKTVTLAGISCAEDYDLDGVSTMDEDVNQDGNLGNDDTDGDGIPDFIDEDDDGDYVLTNIELLGTPGAAETTNFLDTDNDMIPNHRDADDDGDGTLTVNEDYNGNNNPGDDDTNNNNIPDYLDNQVFLSVDEFEITNLRIYPNPAKDKLTVETVTNIRIQNIEIYSVEGRLVYMQNRETPNNRLIVDVSNFNSGFYILKIQTKNKGTLTKRFIVE